MNDGPDGVNSARMTFSEDRSEDCDSASEQRQQEQQLPPPLRPSSHVAPHERTLCYRCLPTSLPESQWRPYCRAQCARSDRSVIELALCRRDGQSCTTAPNSLSSSPPTSSSNEIAPADMRAFFANPTQMHGSASPAPMAHHPTFVCHTSRFRCHLFDVVVGGSDSSEHSDDGGSFAVQCLREVVCMAVTAHTGVMATGGLKRVVKSAPRAPMGEETRLVAERLHCVLARLVPQAFLHSLALGLTMTSPTEHRCGTTVEGLSDISLHWSWVGEVSETTLRRHDSDHTDSENLNPLWRYWVTRLTSANEDTAVALDEVARGGSEAYMMCGDSTTINHRLRLYAQWARRTYFRSAEAHQMCTREEQEAEEVCCALLAVLAEAYVLEVHWTSPLTPIGFHDPHIVERYLLVWFTFIGVSLHSTSAPMDVETAVRSVLLVQARSVAHHSVPLPVRLRGVCLWITFRLLDSVLRWMPRTLPTEPHTLTSTSASTPAPVAARLNETHLLFRRTERSSRGGSSSAATQYRDVWFQSKVKSEGPCHTTHVASLTHLLDQLFACVASTNCQSSSAIRSPHVSHWPTTVLTRRLFTEPSQHKVVVCRLHLCATVKEALSSPCNLSPSFSSAPSVPSLRGPVAALQTWYAADFEFVFRQAHQRWALTQRYGGGSPPCLSRSGGSGMGTHSFVTSNIVDAAIVCYDDAVVVNEAQPSGMLGRGAALNSPAAMIECSKKNHLPPLGLLGRCLLLALWMRLKLMDVDFEGDNICGNGIDEHVSYVEDSIGKLPLLIRGTLYYSSRRNVLFVRDWVTFRQLHSVMVGTTVHDAGDDCHRGTSLHTATPPSLGAAAATVMHAFLRAQLSQRQVREQHRRVAVTALNRREQQQRVLQARRVHAATVLQAWIAACISCRRVRQLRNAREVFERETAEMDAASVISSEDWEKGEEDCVLLHWSAVEDASVSSLESLRSPSTGDEKLLLPQRTRGTEEEMDTNVAQPLTPARVLADEASFIASTEACSAMESLVVLSSPSPPPSAAAPLSSVVSPPLTVGQRHLADLESHERALLVRMEVSEVLWFTSLLECVGRRACEEAEVRTWDLLREKEQRHRTCALQKRTRKPATRGSSGVSTCFGEVHPLHEDEAAPVTMLLPTTPPLTTATEEKRLRAAQAALYENEASARRVIEGVEERVREHICCEEVRLRATSSLFSEEARYRRSLRAMWVVEQDEWQARWSAIVVPECVLRGLLCDALREAPASPVVPGRVERAQTRATARATRPRLLDSASKKPMSAAVVDAAKAHRAFLLEGDAQEVGPDVPSPPQSSPRKRRSASPLPRTQHKGRSAPYASLLNTLQPQSATPKRVPVSQLHTVGTSSPTIVHQDVSSGVKVEFPLSPRHAPSPQPRRFAPVPRLPRTKAAAAERGRSPSPRIPVVSVSLKSDTDSMTTATGSHTPLRELSLNQSSPAHQAPPSTPPSGWWYVPLHDSEDVSRASKAVNDQEKAQDSPQQPRACWPLSGTGSSARRSTQTTTMKAAGQNVKKRRVNLFLHSDALPASAYSSSPPGTDEVNATQKTSQRKKGDEDVSWAVAEAVALARNSSLRAQSPTVNTQVFSPAQRRQMALPYHATALEKKEAKEEGLACALSSKLADVPLQHATSGNSSVGSCPSRPPRKRYVSWADDVQEF